MDKKGYAVPTRFGLSAWLVKRRVKKMRIMMKWPDQEEPGDIDRAIERNASWADEFGRLVGERGTIP